MEAKKQRMIRREKLRKILDKMDKPDKTKISFKFKMPEEDPEIKSDTVPISIEALDLAYF